ncbi:MAG TPA: HdeD family acid-resistance protein, partial [Acetobacteraceae bacterium]
SVAADRQHRGGWGWFVALGILQILLGIFAWFDVIAVSLAGAIFIGAALLIGGLFQIIHAFMDRGWGGFLLQLLAGVLYVIGGFLIMREPVQGAVVITLLVAIMMVVAGGFRVALATRHWHLAGSGLLLFGGLVSIVVGIALYVTLPWSGLWVLGTLIAVELIIHGAAWLEFGLGIRRLRRATP